MLNACRNLGGVDGTGVVLLHELCCKVARARVSPTETRLSL